MKTKTEVDFESLKSTPLRSPISTTPTPIIEFSGVYGEFQNLPPSQSFNKVLMQNKKQREENETLKDANKLLKKKLAKYELKVKQK